MKIGIDARLINETGVGRYIRNLITQLQEIDTKNDYAVFAKNIDSLKLKTQNSKLKWKIVECDIRWHSFEEQLRFSSIMSKEKVDLMHFPYFSVPLLYNKPYIITIHDLIINHFNTGKASTLFYPFYQFKRFSYNLVIKQAVIKAKKIIAVSKATKEEIKEHYKVNDDKIEVIYEGVGDKLNSKLKTQNSKLQLRTQNYFLYVGNAYPHKNLELLIKAFESVSAKIEDINLVLVGKEDFFYQKVKKEVQQKNLSNILFFGQANDNELAELYQNAIALISPSLMEGFGLPPLEAMANKCLTVVSDIPVHQEIAGQGSVYFDPHSAQELTALMLDIAHHPKKYEAYRKKGLGQVKKYSWEKTAQETLKVYESSLSL